MMMMMNILCVLAVLMQGLEPLLGDYAPESDRQCPSMIKAITYNRCNRSRARASV